jgi:hypothetical protein
MDTRMQIGAALALFVGLYVLHRRQVISAYAGGLHMGRKRGYETGLAEARQREWQNGYAQGHEDGLAEGRRKERGELIGSVDRAYERGCQDAIKDYMHTLNAYLVGKGPARSA